MLSCFLSFLFGAVEGLWVFHIAGSILIYMGIGSLGGIILGTLMVDAERKQASDKLTLYARSIVERLRTRYNHNLLCTAIGGATCQRVSPKVKLYELQRKLRMIKLLFRTSFVLVFVGSAGLVCISIILIVQLFSSVMSDPPAENLLGRLLGLAGGIYISLFFLAVSIPFITRYIAYKRVLASWHKSIPVIEMPREMKLWIERFSEEIGIEVPRGLVLPGNTPNITTQQFEQKYAIFASSAFMESFADKPNEATAAIVHELFHIKSRDLGDMVRMVAVREAVQNAFEVVEKMLNLFMSWFPYSLVFILFLFIHPLFVATIVFVCALLWLSNVPIVPAASVLIGTLYSLLFIPIAMILGKMNQLMEMRADMGAAVILGDKASVVSLLQQLRPKAPNTHTALRAVGERLKKVFDDKNWRENAHAILGIVTLGIYDYCFLWLSNVESRIKTLEEPKISHYSWKAVITKARVFSENFFLDIATNEDCQAGLSFGLLFSPLFCIILYVVGVRDLLWLLLYFLMFLVLLAKGAKYLKLLLDEADKSMDFEENPARNERSSLHP